MNDAALPFKRVSLVRQPDFLRFWLSRTLSALGFQIITIVVGWHVYALTHDTFQLGIVGLMQFLPMILLTLPAGAIADRMDRRLVVRVCQSVEALAAMGLAAGAYAGWLGTSVIFLAVAAIGAARAFESPTVAALLPGVISAEDLPPALALSASAMQTATIVGPAVGGMLYLLGSVWAFSVVAALYVAASLSVGGIRIKRADTRREKVSFASLLSGFVYIRDHTMVLGAISLDLFAVLLGGATALLPVYAQDVLHTSLIGLGMLRGAPAVGALATSLILARYPMRRHAGAKMFGAVALFGFATIIFGLSRWFPLSLIALMVLGASDVVSVVVRSSLVQILTPDAMRGRVSAVNSMFIGTSNQLGEFESGVTASLFGAVPAVVLGGIGTMLVAILWSRMFPSLRDVQSLANLP